MRICRYCHKPTSDLKGSHQGCRNLERERLTAEAAKAGNSRPAWLNAVERRLHQLSR